MIERKLIRRLRRDLASIIIKCLVQLRYEGKEVPGGRVYPSPFTKKYYLSESYWRNLRSPKRGFFEICAFSNVKFFTDFTIYVSKLTMLYCNYSLRYKKFFEKKHFSRYILFRINIRRFSFS